MPNRLSALIVGRSHHLSWELLQTLTQAGFSVDVITSDRLMNCSRLVKRCTVVPTDELLIPALSKSLQKGYDWIIVAGDRELLEIVNSSLELEQKLAILPVRKAEKLYHLHSKIGLSKLFREHGVTTPPFFIATTIEEALPQAKEMGYPLLAKVDASGGGVGVFQCNKPEDFTVINTIRKK